MEILKRAKGDSGEGVPWNANPKEVREEMLRRNAKAGYCNKDGSPLGAGKSFRAVNKRQYDENYDRIFNKGA